MAKKRSCRRTEEENKQHELAVKVRKMTDKQIVDLLSGKSVRLTNKDPKKKYTDEDLNKEFFRGHTIGKDEGRRLAESLQKQLEEQGRLTEQQIRSIQIETKSKIADQVFNMSLAIVLYVLKREHWRKVYKTKFPDFINSCMKTKDTANPTKIKELVNEIHDITGINLMEV